jgi:hypothetical protein
MRTSAAFAVTDLCSTPLRSARSATLTAAYCLNGLKPNERPTSGSATFRRKTARRPRDVQARPLVCAAETQRTARGQTYPRHLPHHRVRRNMDTTMNCAVHATVRATHVRTTTFGRRKTSKEPLCSRCATASQRYGLKTSTYRPLREKAS